MSCCTCPPAHTTGGLRSMVSTRSAAMPRRHEKNSSFSHASSMTGPRIMLIWYHRRPRDLRRKERMKLVRLN